MSGLSEADEGKLIRRMLEKMTPEEEGLSPPPPGLGPPQGPFEGSGDSGDSGDAGQPPSSPGDSSAASEGSGGTDGDFSELPSLLRALLDEMREVNVKLDTMPEDIREALGANVG